MATKLLNTVLKCTPNLRHHGNQPSSRELNLPGLCADALAAWATDHPADLSYRVELARRIALTFDDADQLIIMDDVALVVPQSERAQFHGMRGCDRSLLPALWLATGFRAGAKLLVYAPPNPVEMKTYLKLKKLIEDRLQRVIPIGIFYEDEQGDLHELIELFEKDSARYTSLCEQFAQRPIDAFYPEYHVQLLKRYVEKFTKDIRCSFVFPYEMTEYHRQELASYSDRLKLPDLPISDKAKHNLFLKSKGFPSLPKLVAVAASGKLIDTYAEYLHAIENSDEIDTENTDENIVKFAGGVIEAVNLLSHQHRVSAFVKLDASGAAGWSCMSPAAHPILYNCQEDGEKRLKYLCDYMRSKVVGNRLPTLAVVEEFIQAEKRPGNIDADYTVCGFVLNGKFFPTSINLCGTINGSYIEQWTSSTPIDLNDSPTYWQRMFQTYSMMVNLEAQEFGYYNGVYAGDLFVTKEGQHKQRDWNIRRGGRSSPEALTLFGMPNYETKVTISMADLHLNQPFSNLQLFHLYTDVCQSLLDDYGMYVFSSAFGYCGKDDRKNDYLKFNVLVHPKWLVNIGTNGEKISVPRYEHRAKVQQIVRDTTAKILQRRQC